MPQFRKKPVVIEAVLYDAHAHSHFWFSEDGWDECPEWLQEAADQEVFSFVAGDGEGFTDDKGVLQTLEGPLTVSLGDWIIRGVKGELYPCKPDIFEATYEPADG
jgi:hypothetical protein